MNEERQKQVSRILSMYDRLQQEQGIVKKQEAMRFGVSEKSIQRDLENIRTYVETERQNEYLEYNRTKGAYFITSNKQWLTNEELFSILKVLIESRAFPKHEMYQTIEKLQALAHKEERSFINQMIQNEKHLYVEPCHKKDLLQSLWQLSTAIQSKKVIAIHYLREGSQVANERLVKPVGIIFSEYYFYLIAYQVKNNFDFPTVYRIDRIEQFKQTGATFDIPYRDRFQEGEFRKRVQFMYTGELITIQFRFTGTSTQAVIDRLPTAKIIKVTEEATYFEAEVFGTGIKMWLLSQGANIEVLAPPAFRAEMVETMEHMLNRYR